MVLLVYIVIVVLNCLLCLSQNMNILIEFNCDVLGCHEVINQSHFWGGNSCFSACMGEGKLKTIERNKHCPVFPINQR